MDTTKPNIYKLNTDGTHSSVSNRNGIGGIIRDHKGNWILGFSVNILYQSIIATELFALLQRFTLAVQHNLKPFQVEIDEVLTLLHDNNIIYANLLTDCRHLLGQLHDPIVSHAYREKNKLADQLTKSESFLEGTLLCRFFNNHHFLLAKYGIKISGVYRLHAYCRLLPLSAWDLPDPPTVHAKSNDNTIPNVFGCCDDKSTTMTTNSIASTNNDLPCNMVLPEHQNLCMHMFV